MNAALTTLASLDDLRSLREKPTLFPLAKAYTDTVLAKADDDRGGMFHPSCVGSCAKRNVYEYLRFPTRSRTSAKLREIYNMGHHVHDLLQTRLDEMIPQLATKGITMRFSREVSYDQETDYLWQLLNLGGTTDGIIELERVGLWKQKGIVEIKSCGEAVYEVVSTSNAAMPDHLLQATIYAYRYNAPVIWIWYFRKSTSDSVIIPYLFDELKLIEALSRFQVQLEYAQSNELPDGVDEWFECRDCNYTVHCQPSSLQNNKRDRAEKLTQVTKKGFRR